MERSSDRSALGGSPVPVPKDRRDASKKRGCQNPGCILAGKASYLAARREYRQGPTTASLRSHVPDTPFERRIEIK
jgi:hypothetical protein